MNRDKPTILERVVIGVGTVMIAYVVRLVIGALLAGKGAFLPFYPAVAIATAFGGRSAGVLATVLASVLASSTLPQLSERSLPARWDEVVLTLVFAAVNLSLVWLTDGLVRARREAHEALAARERVDLQLNQILNSITDSFAIIDRQWRFTYVNDAALRNYQTKAEEFLGRSLWDHFPHLVASDFQRYARRAMETGQPERFEYFSERLGRWFDYRFYPSTEGMSLYATDIHERKVVAEQREAIFEAERAAHAEVERTSRLKDEFLATLSHELRTPLNAILGWSTFIGINEGLDHAETREAVATIERNARAQAKLIEDLLEMNAIISGKLRLDVQDVDLPLAVESSLATVRHAADAKRIHLQKHLDPELGSVRGDPARIQQVIWNLLSNAIKFTPHGGSVRIAIERAADEVRIIFDDTGQGIAADFLPYVFDRFRQADSSTTRRFGGLGLGLSIVKHLVELHGGEVTADSRGENQGATFTVRLPCTPGRSFEKEPRGRETGGSAGLLSPQLTAVRVLVVDDEPDTVRLVKKLLEEHEATVATACTVAEAFDALSIDEPDVLISDIGLPDEDGYSLIRKVRSASKPALACLPAVALTAFASAEDQRRTRSAGYHLHLAKPIDSAELVAAIAGLVSRRKP